MARRAPGFIRAAAVACAATALLAGCGTGAGGVGADGNRVRVVAVESHGAGDPARQARAYARRLLASLPVPAGARRTAWPAHQPRILRPMLPGNLGDSVRVRVLYRVPAAMPAVDRFLSGHVPHGMRLYGYGSEWPLAEYVSYVSRRLPGGIAYAQLATAVIPARGRGSLLRADVQVTWYPPRRQAEHIDPARYASVRVMVSSASRTVSRRLTGRAMGRLAALINRLPTTPPTMTGCGLVSLQSISFEPRAPRSPTVVMEPACGTVYVRVGGRVQPGLGDGHNALADALLRLLGLPVRGPGTRG
jgi:hypothetical protein